MMSFRFLTLTVILATTANAFFVHPTTTTTSALSVARSHRHQPSPAQQEQLDKFGATPETAMEILFDQLLGEGGAEDFYKATNADDVAREKWESFLSNMAKQQGNSANPMSPKDVCRYYFSEGSKS
uniref:RxLR effector protein n=1 Tax=Amphora coffeiformis TaxID=265554 RepID=A0A7S3L5Z6_9STRA|mmetsp:Transcript_9106/g.17373  ORF Transcript_9106/g.17373 Transcript_9106/m.17373 type:complete len:126 (+) Transcript_9106:290-667(+)|eukprot:scaffold370_cov176-Amphora_coffeaeformis.AAC.25